MGSTKLCKITGGHFRVIAGLLLQAKVPARLLLVFSKERLYYPRLQRKARQFVGLRQKLNENPAVTAAITGVFMLAATFLFYRTSCSDSGGRSAGLSKSYFTIDDGKTYFADDTAKLPPFDHQGKPAYRVRLFKCKDGTIFVSHLERYSDSVKKKIEAERQKTGISLNPTILGNMELKKPGDAEWVSMSAGQAKYLAILQPKCPDGSENMTAVLPEN